MRVIGWIGLALLGQRGHLFAWSPVCLGTGIGLFFQIRQEPEVAFLWACFGSGCLLVALARRLAPDRAPLVWALALVVLGFALAGARAHWVAGPVLQYRYYGPVEGTIVGIDRSASDALRITLAGGELANIAWEDTPHRLRVALHGQAMTGTAIRAGLRVILTAHLAPPSGPVEPGGFDFQRHAWFGGLGGVGYTRTPVLAIEPPSGQRLLAFRLALAQAIRDRMPAETGAFAAAITTGDRSAIPIATLEELRASNLAHLLAISGLHMGLLAGVVFAAARFGLALIPWMGLRLPAKKLAAGVALAAAAAYLALSGGNVATERAFVMAAVALIAVIFDRRAFSLRAVALAALIVLVLRPEALLGPGFQMSFAATTALVAVFGLLRDLDLPSLPRVLRPVAAVFLSSLVAGAATAPIAAAHFNQIAQFGLIANLLSVPVMGAVIAPAAVLAAVLAPLGLENIGLAVMGLGLDWVLGVARWVAAMPDARRFVPSPGPAVLPLLALGMLWLVLVRGRLRWLGVVPSLFAFVVWSQVVRPDVLIADTGALVGVLESEGRALSRPKGQGFVARTWLENDGERVSQQVAAARWPHTQKAGLHQTAIGDRWLIHLAGRGARDLEPRCRAQDILVSAHRIEVELPCPVFDPDSLRASGAVAIYLENGVARAMSARDVTGLRMWHGRAQ